MKGGRITVEEKSVLSAYIAIAIAVLLTAGALYFFLLAQREKSDTHGFDPNRPIPTDDVLQRRLTPEQYFVVRQGGSQTPFQNQLWNNERPGIYVDVITGEPLFTSLDQYDSGMGFPSFTKPISYDILVEKPDNSEGMQRIEVRAKRSDAHLGHIFGDPKSPTGRQYSIQAGAVHFIPKEEMVSAGYEAYLPLLEKK